jgi:hypothetical protein
MDGTNATDSALIGLGCWHALLPAQREPWAPIKGLKPYSIALKSVAKLFGHLQGLAGLIGVSKTSADPMLLWLCSRRVSGLGGHRGPQPDPTPRHIKGDTVTFQPQSGVLADEPGI